MPGVTQKASTGANKERKDVSAKFSLLTHADGSAQICIGKSCTLVSINGPDQVSAHREIIDRAVIEVHYEPKSGQSSCKDKQLESFIRQMCNQVIMTTMHPRTSILVNITELHDDGCVLAAAVNSTVLALCDAGIPMKHMVAAATCCVNEDSSIIVDPSKDDVMQSCAGVTAVIENESNNILSIVSKGSLTAAKLTECITLLTERCSELFSIFRANIAEW